MCGGKQFHLLKRKIYVSVCACVVVTAVVVVVVVYKFAGGKNFTILHQKERSFLLRLTEFSWKSSDDEEEEHKQRIE